MADRIELTLSPTGGNSAGTARITPELIAYHAEHARRLRAAYIGQLFATLREALTGAAARRRAEAADCAAAAWLTR